MEYSGAACIALLEQGTDNTLNLKYKSLETECLINGALNDTPKHLQHIYSPSGVVTSAIDTTNERMGLHERLCCQRFEQPINACDYISGYVVTDSNNQWKHWNKRECKHPFSWTLSKSYVPIREICKGLLMVHSLDSVLVQWQVNPSKAYKQSL